MLPYKSVHIIYNPKSTGKSKQNAFKLKHSLVAQLKNMQVRVVATEHAGHAKELAKEVAETYDRPLIVSSSGDGGYNEVINGVMLAGNKGRGALCSVLASGNANDHSRTMQERPLHQAILEGSVTAIDLLHFAFVFPDKSVQQRYAHSYAGLGLTPVVAKEVNAHSFNRWQELVLVVRVFWRFTPFRIKQAGKVRNIDNLVFSNINKMAKVFKLSKQNNPSDGKFRVLLFPHAKKRLLAVNILKAIFGRVENIEVYDQYAFTALQRMPMQLDGEVIDLPAKTVVTVKAAKQTLKTIV